MSEPVTTKSDNPGAPADPRARRRLHPLTPLLKGAKSLAIAVAAISWQGYAQLGVERFLLVVAGVLIVTVLLSVVSWWVTGFEVVGRELRINEGLVWRRARAIPLERVQAIDVNRPLLARLAGVAELRIEVIGARKTEAPLAFLSVAEAATLRRRLLTLAQGVAAQDEPDAAGPERGIAPPDAHETPIHTVDNRHVLIANLLSPPVLFVPFALLATITPMAFAPPTVSVIGIASAVTGLFGVVLPPLRRVFAQWNFRISFDATGLRLRHGLLDTRSQTVPPLRVQAVQVTRPLLWRPLGWVRTRLDVAGYGGNAAEQGVRGSVLLPVADWPTTRAVIAHVLAGADIDALPLAPIPERAKVVTPLARRNRAFGYTGTVVAARDGWLTVRLVIAKLARVQSVRVVQGPVQRSLGLTDLHVDTAGGLHVVGRDRDATQAYELARDLADRSRAARVTDGSGAAGTGAGSLDADPAAPADEPAVDLVRHQRSASAHSPNANPTYTQPTRTSTT